MNKIKKKPKSRLKSEIAFKNQNWIESLRKSGYWTHGARILLLVIITSLSLFLTPGRRGYDPFFDIRAGTVSDQDVVAPFDFKLYKTEAELAKERTEAAAEVIPLLEYLPGTRETVLHDVLNFFDRLKSAEKNSVVASELISWEAFLKEKNALDSRYSISPSVLNFLYSVDSLLSLSDEEIVFLFDPVRSGILRSRLKDFLVSRMRDGVIGNEEFARIENVEVKLRKGGVEKVIGKAELTTVSRVLELSRSVVVDQKYEEVSRNIFIETVSRFIRPNIIVNWAETEHLRRLARAQVKTMRDEMVLKGERIIGTGERVTPQQIERLEALRAQLEKKQMLPGEANRLKRDLGISLVYLVLLLILGLFFLFHRHDIYYRMSRLIIIAISFLLVILSARLILEGQAIPGYLIPVAVSSMLIAYLIDDQVSMVSTFCLALILGVQANFSIYIVLLSLAGGFAGAISVRRTSMSRQDQYISILYIAVAYVLAILAIDYGYRGETFAEVLSASGWCSLNAFGSTLVTIGILPLFEYVFKITSNFTLLELSDLNRPMFKRLALEAPGTYHHSIIIGNLAEAAAAGIGANPIYARVAGYYHDIGKLRQPQYFIENQHGKENPHDKLSPKMSSLIISNHVKEGVELARKSGLPKPVIDVIRQHHGNTSISFFYSKEKEQNPGTTLVMEDFCYPGPRPQTREAAIIMLADVVESASRTLTEPTVSRIKGLIKGVIQKKLNEGQLDETGLTLKDLTRIGDEFLTILIGVHHQRIDYTYPVEKGQHARKAGSSRNRDPS
ncbi:MAG: HDIG domain-containing protein, partial [Gemmatimonadota bacterium]|nr:HDIG domain-containing protein [Gemmatimonadota bacterium]